MNSKVSAAAAMALFLNLLIWLPCLANELTDKAAEEEGGFADADDAVIQQINDLTNEIILREIGLQRINALFRIESTRQPRLRNWRQFAYSETNSNMTEAALIGRMALSYPYVKKDTGRPDQRAVQRCAATSMVGQLFAAGGESYEVLANLRSYWRARKNGLDPKSYREKLTSSAQEIDSLIGQRDRLISSIRLSEADVKIVNAETALLKDVRDLALVQYGQYHAGARRLRFFQNAAYLISISKSLAGATSNILNIQASRLRNNNIAGNASLLNLIAGALVIATPVFGRVSGNLAGLADRRIVNKDFADAQARGTDTFVRDRLRLTTILNEPGASATVRSDEMTRGEVYAHQEALLLAQERNIERERKQARKTTVENVVTGAVVGSSRMTAGILGMVGAWKYPDAPWISSRYTAAASTIYGAGAAFNSMETARVRISQALHDRRDARRGLLPRQVLKQRLATLDVMSQLLTREGIAVAKPDSIKAP